MSQRRFASGEIRQQIVKIALKFIRGQDFIHRLFNFPEWRDKQFRHKRPSKIAKIAFPHIIFLHARGKP